MSHSLEPAESFGKIDIYLFDQILRGRIAPGMRVLDAGCGSGRNLHYFLKAGYDVAACDPRPEAIEKVEGLAAELAPGFDSKKNGGAFRLEAIEENTFDTESFEVVICNALLHFAKDDAHMRAMLTGCWRLLRPGGLFFARLASNIGIEGLVQPLGNRRFLLPDETERYLVDEQLLLQLTEELGAELLDPIKTTNVQNLRCMTTWVMRRGS